MIRIETPPGDLNADNALDSFDIDELAAFIRGERLGWRGVRLGWLNDIEMFDINNDSSLDDHDRHDWIFDLKRTYFGDANLDGEFDSDDLVVALAAGTYETDVDAGWASGDFDGSGKFDSSDLIFALADGGYEQGPRPAAVPESSGGVMPLVVLAAAFGRRRN